MVVATRGARARQLAEAEAAAIEGARPCLINLQTDLLLSVANQFIRVHLLRSVMLPSERALWTTEKVHSVVKRMLMWNWSSVLRKVIVLCVFYMVCTVGVSCRPIKSQHARAVRGARRRRERA